MRISGPVGIEWLATWEIYSGCLWSTSFLYWLYEILCLESLADTYKIVNRCFRNKQKNEWMLFLPSLEIHIRLAKNGWRLNNGPIFWKEETIERSWLCLKPQKRKQPWLVWLSGLSAGLQTKGLLVWFPVKAYAWVVGQVPSRGHVRGNHTLMFPFLFPALPLSLKIN